MTTKRELRKQISFSQIIEIVADPADIKIKPKERFYASFVFTPECKQRNFNVFFENETERRSFAQELMGRGINIKFNLNNSSEASASNTGKAVSRASFSFSTRQTLAEKEANLEVEEQALKMQQQLLLPEEVHILQTKLEAAGIKLQAMSDGLQELSDQNSRLQAAHEASQQQQQAALEKACQQDLFIAQLQFQLKQSLFVQPQLQEGAESKQRISDEQQLKVELIALSSELVAGAGGQVISDLEDIDLTALDDLVLDDQPEEKKSVIAAGETDPEPGAMRVQTSLIQSQDRADDGALELMTFKYDNLKTVYDELVTKLHSSEANFKKQRNDLQEELNKVRLENDNLLNRDIASGDGASANELSRQLMASRRQASENQGQAVEYRKQHAILEAELAICKDREETLKKKLKFSEDYEKSMQKTFTQERLRYMDRINQLEIRNFEVSDKLSRALALSHDENRITRRQLSELHARHEELQDELFSELELTDQEIYTLYNERALLQETHDALVARHDALVAEYKQHLQRFSEEKFNLEAVIEEFRSENAELRFFFMEGEQTISRLDRDNTELSNTIEDLQQQLEKALKSVLECECRSRQNGKSEGAPLLEPLISEEGDEVDKKKKKSKKVKKDKKDKKEKESEREKRKKDKKDKTLQAGELEAAIEAKRLVIPLKKISLTW